MSTAPKRIRYALVPGWVISSYDGDRHWINGPQLAYLYNLKPGTWRIAGVNPPLPDEVALHPRNDGNYALPSTADDH